jgi:beta-galactosidase
MLALVLSGLLGLRALSQAPRHTFGFQGQEFVLDGKPFRVISGELHPARIPREYWTHRVQMAKAMGCNTIAVYVFWNYHESPPGKFDYATGNHDLAEFVRIVQREGLWVLIRPGPYVCAEWDFGGIPAYLLAAPDLKIRCMDPRYMEAVERFLTSLADVIRPLLITRGGPILMVQIENEYGSYGNDKRYLTTIRDIWQRCGVDVPFYTADGPAPHMLEAGSVEGAALGLDSGSDESSFAEARKHNPNVPAFSSETYPGWLTHWGEQWARPDTTNLYREVRFLLASGRSFNFYMLHGGTNFGFWAGANSGGKGYEPDLTSYDYDAPINEQGRATHKFAALREMIRRYVPSVPDPPAPLPTTDIAEFTLTPFVSIWSNIPTPVSVPQPRPMESFGQATGLILYRTKLIGHKSGKLTITDPHDYALVFLDGSYIGTVDRRLGGRTIEIPRTGTATPVLEILVEAMGRINYGAEMIDRKGITDRVTLNGMTLMDWEVSGFPLDDSYVQGLAPAAVDTARRGIFFRGSFSLAVPADTYIDMSGCQKGIVWVNGHNLGRYWNIGPQQRLYCPAPWLRSGRNEVLVFDLHATSALVLRGRQTLQ